MLHTGVQIQTSSQLAWNRLPSLLAGLLLRAVTAGVDLDVRTETWLQSGLRCSGAKKHSAQHTDLRNLLETVIRSPIMPEIYQKSKHFRDIGLRGNSYQQETVATKSTSHPIAAFGDVATGS